MHSRYPLNIREEELKNRVGKDFFEQYDTTKIIAGAQLTYIHVSAQ